MKNVWSLIPPFILFIENNNNNNKVQNKQANKTKKTWLLWAAIALLHIGGLLNILGRSPGNDSVGVLSGQLCYLRIFSLIVIFLGWPASISRQLMHYLASVMKTTSCQMYLLQLSTYYCMILIFCRMSLSTTIKCTPFHCFRKIIASSPVFLGAKGVFSILQLYQDSP